MPNNKGTRNSRPTPQQRKTAENLVENSRKPHPDSLGKVLVDSGYSENTAIKPHQVLESKGFQQALIEAGVTDEKLSQVLTEGLAAEGKDGTPDHATRHRFLETGIKVKGYIQPGADPITPPIQNNTFNIISGETVEDFTKMIMEKTKAVDVEES